MSPAGRDVVDMVSFLADSEHKRSNVRKQHTCVKLHVSNVKKELCQSPSPPPPPPTDIPWTSTNEGIKYTHPCTGTDTPSNLQK